MQIVQAQVTGMPSATRLDRADDRRPAGRPSAGESIGGSLELQAIARPSGEGESSPSHGDGRRGEPRRAAAARRKVTGSSSSGSSPPPPPPGQQATLAPCKSALHAVGLDSPIQLSAIIIFAHLHPDPVSLGETLSLCLSVAPAGSI